MNNELVVSEWDVAPLWNAPCQVLAEAREFHAAKDAQLERAIGTESMSGIQIDRIVRRLQAAVRGAIGERRARRWSNRIRRPYELVGSGTDGRAVGRTQMRPIQAEIIELGRHVAQPDTKGRTVLRVDRLVAPIRRRYRERAYQGRVLFEIAGTGLQEQERAAYLEMRTRVRWNGLDDNRVGDVQRDRWRQHWRWRCAVQHGCATDFFGPGLEASR